MKRLLSFLAMAAAASFATEAYGIDRIRFVVTDPATGQPVQDAVVNIVDLSGHHLVVKVKPGSNQSFDAKAWQAITLPSDDDGRWTHDPIPDLRKAPTTTTITLPLDRPVEILTQDQIPTKEIYIKVTATRILSSSASQEKTRAQIQQFATGGGGSGGANSLIKGAAGAASDSTGQQHVRGEHAEISYVVDGVPLPDTLSGRQGAIVVPSTVQNLEIMEGAYAPQYGGQTAAILNVTTLPGSKKFSEDVTLDGGTFNTFDGDLTAVGPIGSKASFTLDLQGSRTGVYQEPQQPNNDTAHNTGEYYSLFSKIKYAPTSKDSLSLTVSHNPDQYQDNNRTGLPDSFSDVGQGYGFLGLRDANGTLPQQINPGGLGSAPMILPSQQAAGMDINSSEENEFAVLSWRRQIDLKTYSLLSLTALHSGDSVTNGNPAVNEMALPIDNSIEYNPDVTRNAHHLQGTGEVTTDRGHHELKAGFLLDEESGNESYNIAPASQLALDELADLDPQLAPAGSVEMASGKPVLDVNGNPVYMASSNTVPTLQVHRTGSYDAAYVQDTWRLSRSFNVNYGFRYDHYYMSENIETTPVDTSLISPRINFSWAATKRDTLRWSYNKLFDTPPLAEGAIVGAPIVPETLDQYDASIQHDLGRDQDIKLAYYAKLIRNQVDTGLLVPGSEIGLFSAVNFQFGGVHGIEATYDIYAPKGLGWDGFLNYSYSEARPNGLDNTGAPAPEYNDHDQRNTIGAGLAYTWKNQSSAAVVFSYGSGLASSIIRDNERVPRSETDIKYTSSPMLFNHHGGFGVDVDNLFDATTVINFESGFSGTRFMEGRRITLSLFEHF